MSETPHISYKKKLGSHDRKGKTMSHHYHARPAPAPQLTISPTDSTAANWKRPKVLSYSRDEYHHVWYDDRVCGSVDRPEYDEIRYCDFTQQQDHVQLQKNRENRQRLQSAEHDRNDELWQNELEMRAIEQARQMLCTSEFAHWLQHKTKELERQRAEKRTKAIMCRKDLEAAKAIREQKANEKLQAWKRTKSRQLKQKQLKSKRAERELEMQRQKKEREKAARSEAKVQEWLLKKAAQDAQVAKQRKKEQKQKKAAEQQRREEATNHYAEWVQTRARAIMSEKQKQQAEQKQKEKELQLELQQRRSKARIKYYEWRSAHDATALQSKPTENSSKCIVPPLASADPEPKQDPAELDSQQAPDILVKRTPHAVRRGRSTLQTLSVVTTRTVEASKGDAYSTTDRRKEWARSPVPRACYSLNSPRVLQQVFAREFPAAQ
jgi:Coiled-coil domain-containing protein 34